MDLMEAIPYTEKWWKIEGVLGEIFSTQAKLKDEIRAINTRATPGEPMDLVDESFLIEVLRRHHDWTAKQGTEVDHLEVRNNAIHGRLELGLWIVRVDRSEVDISWVTPLSPNGGAGSTKHHTIAARAAVCDQIDRARSRLNCGVCGICRLPLKGMLHVDHAWPLTFSALFEGWLKAEKLTLDRVGVLDLGTTSAFAHKEQIESWAAYHGANADLRVVHAACNLSKGNRE